MPTRSRRPCAFPRCPTLLERGRFCTAHVRVEVGETRQRDYLRGSSSERLYGARWRRERAVFLAEHPLCQCELHRDRLTAPAATVVDHITPHQGDLALFWDRSNWQAMAKPCHDRKTAIEDGRWGRRACAV